MYVTGAASSVKELFTAICNLFDSVGWTANVVAKDDDGSYSSVIYCGVGSGKDVIYVHLSRKEDSKHIIIDSCAGYDINLSGFEQPGSLRQWKKFTGNYEGTMPALSISDNQQFIYWLFLDSYRLIVICRMSIIYESMYLGFIDPIANERQYPYPMYIAGNSLSTETWPSTKAGSFAFPNNGTGWLRRADGTWRQFECTPYFPSISTKGSVFPYICGNKKLISNYSEIDLVNQNNFLLIPLMLMTSDPTDVCGILRGCFWISGTRDIDAERVLVYNGSSYIVFDTKSERGTNSYFCVKLE